MTRFDWHTEEETDWENPTPRPQPRRRFGWLLGLLLVLAIAVAGLAATVRVRMDRIEEDVRQAAAFLYETARNGDVALYESMLAGRDATWTEAQLTAVTDGTLLDRSAFRLDALDDAPAVADITLSPELDAATVLSEVRFQTTGASGLPVEITLALPTVWQHADDGRWLSVPPSESFWGEQMTDDGRTIRMIYPQRDAAFARQLHADLETAVAKLCSPAYDFNCPDGLALVVVLNPNIPLGWLADTQLAEAATRTTLPAPSLVGLPVDAAGEQALRSGYARRVLLPLLAGLTNYRCCNHILYFEALADWLLSELGFAPWPRDAERYAALLDDADIAINLRVDVGWDVDHAGQATAEQASEVRALVDFIHTADPALTSADVLRSIGPRSQRITSWFETLMAARPPQTGLGQDWLPTFYADSPGAAVENANLFLYRFLAQRAARPPAPPPRSFPSSDVIAACQDGDSGVLLRYEFETDSWHEYGRVPGADLLRVTSLPAQDALWLEQSPDRDAAIAGRLLWPDGRLSATNNLENVFLSESASPDGSQLLLTGWDGQLRHQLLRLQNCNEEHCAGEIMPGNVNWSPDGRHRLVELREENLVAVQTRAGATLHEIEAAFTAVAWLDAHTLVWWADDPALINDDGRFYRYDLATDTTQPWFHLDALTAVLPDHIARGHQPLSILPDPSNPTQLLVTILVDAVTDLHYVVAYDTQTGAARWLEDLGQAGLFAQDQSPPYLLGYQIHSEGQRQRLLVYNTAAPTPATAATSLPLRESINAYATADWHADGHWLLLFGAGHIRLFTPAEGYSRIAFPPLTTCTSAAWLSRPSLGG